MKIKLLCGICLCLLAGTLAAFEAKTRIFPANCEAVLRIKATSKWAKEWLNIAVEMKKAGKDKVKKGRAWPLVGYFREDRRYSDSEEYRSSSFIPEPLDFTVEGDEILVKTKLPGENIHSIVFSKLPAKPKGFRNFRNIKFQTLDQETFKLRPFKGNVHQHSNVSDGKFDPQDHVAYARIAGFDFISVADHRSFKQNAPTIAWAEKSGSGLTVYPGEELHTPNNVLHALSIGGTTGHSVSSRTPEWNKTVQPVLNELVKKYPGISEKDLVCWAEALILARRAKADGALVVYCHPAWRPRHYINNNFPMIDFLIRSKEFHAIEIINSTMADNSRRDNLDAWAVFHEICVETGTKIAPISNSDSHNVSKDAYRRTYSLFFAPDCTFASFKEAVINGRIVACYDISPDRATPQPLHLGASKYVRYANFLDATGYWKKHDEIARKQGELIHKLRKGDQSVLPEITKLAKEINQYRCDFYYQEK